MEVAQAAEQRRVVIRRHVASPVTQASRSRSGTSISRSNSSSSASLKRADLRVGEAADDQVHLAHAAMPGAEQQLAPPLVQAFARSCRSPLNASLQREKPGRCRARRYIDGLARAECQPASATQRLHSARLGASPASSACGPLMLDPLFAALTSLPGVGPKLEKLFARLLGREERRASSICCSICRPASIDRRARPKLRDVRAGHGRHRRGDGRPAPPAAAAPAARALPDLRQRRDRRRSR